MSILAFEAGMLRGTDIIVRALSVGQQPVLRASSSKHRHSSFRVDYQYLPFAAGAPPSNPYPEHAHTKKFDKPRRDLGSDANQRARIIQVSEFESCRSQDLNHANNRKENPRTVRETAAALAHLRPRRPFPVSLFYSGSIPP